MAVAVCAFIGLFFAYSSKILAAVPRGGAGGRRGHMGYRGKDGGPPIYPKPEMEHTAICNFSMSFRAHPFDSNLPLIYFITPTYTRREQVIYL